MKSSHLAGVFALFLVGCEPMVADWQLADSLELTVPIGAEGAKEAPAAPVADDRFPSDDEFERMKDPFGEDEEAGSEKAAEQTEAGVEGLEQAEPAEVTVEGVVADAPPVPEEELGSELEKEELVSVEHDGLVKATRSPMIESPGWGVRLVASIPQAQPPRAVLGLPSGKEVVVSPGSMIPEAAVVVIAVGPGTVVLAEITPDGDHARVEQRTLHAQYKMGVPASE